MSAPTTPTAQQLARERSLQVALSLDGVLLVGLFGVAVGGGSLTMLAEWIRGVLMVGTEVFALVVMRRIHRGQLIGLEFGSGKLEQAANMVIATGMFLGAAWIGLGALELALGDRPHGTPIGLAVAAILAALNTYFNFVAWISVLQATPPGSPVIMEAQLRSRAVKLLSSGVVVFLVAFSAVCFDPVVAVWCDIIGATFVSAYIILNAVEMVRNGLPDLLDRCGAEAMQRSINRALAAHFDDYDELQRVRSRRSGKTLFVEIALGFDPALTMADVDRRIRAIRATLQREIAEAEINVLVASRT